MKKEKINITAIWWWSGTFNVLYGLKRYIWSDKLDISAIIAVTDSGWTAGKIRDEYWVLPPGDLRRAIAALAEDTGIVRKLFEYKFEESGIIWWNKIWNILLTALADIKWSFEDWLAEACKMFRVKWNVIPVTLEDVHLWVIMEDGTKIIWEKNIDVSETNPWEKSHNTNQNIKDAFLVWGKWVLNPKAKKIIENSDVIIIWPGDFYTSIVPNLLSEGMKETIQKSKAKKIYICNIMADKWETTTYELPDFINGIERYIWNIIDIVLVNNWYISDQLIAKYKDEGKKPVKLKEWMNFEWKRYKIIEVDLLNERDFIRHSPQKIAKIIEKLI